MTSGPAEQWQCRRKARWLRVRRRGGGSGASWRLVLATD
jgi:hypothetical protein